MAEQEINVEYVKSPLWRVVYATGASIGLIGGPTGQQVILRFTNEWAEIVKETFRADVNQAAGTYAVKTEPKIVLGPLMKLEEVAITTTADGIGNLTAGLLGQFSTFSSPVKQRIRDAIAKLPQT